MHKHMKVVAATTLVVLAGLFTVNAGAGDGCATNARADMPDCSTWWYEGDYPYKTAYVKNNCPGTLSVKIDIKGGRDQLWTMAPTEEKRETYGKTIRAVKCCSNLADGCNQITDSCRNNFTKSDAQDSCRTFNFNEHGDMCTVTAECTTTRGSIRAAEITVKISEVGYIQNCDGFFRLNSC